MMVLPKLLERKRGLGMTAVICLTLVQGAGAAAAAFATRRLFEAMHSGASLQSTDLTILVGSGALIAATRVAARQIGESIGQDYAKQIRAAVFEHAARMPARAVMARRPGYMSLRFVGDMAAFRNWPALGLPRLVAAIVLVPALLTVLWLLDPIFAIAVFPVIALALSLITLGGIRLVPMQRRLRARRARIAADMAERMSIAPYLDRLGRRERELSLLERRTTSMVETALRHRLTAECLNVVPDLSAGIAAALIIVVGHMGGLGTGDIAAALATLGLLLAPLRDLGGVWNYRAAHKVASTKAQAALSRMPRDLYRAGKSLPKGKVDVVVDDVGLPSGQRLSLKAAGGTIYDLFLDELDADFVLDMLLGLDAPPTGRIMLSGIELPDLSRGTLRRNVQSIGVRPVILQGSLRRALVMGCDDRPDDATLVRLASDAGLGKLLDRLGGLGGTVLEGGKNLTQSERLGIALVRTSLAQPRLVVAYADYDPAVLPKALLDLHRANEGLTIIRLVACREGVEEAA
jgi:ABC-type transport system involved in cytochrome bd biosynthesis fused ATPase/permease subunit